MTPDNLSDIVGDDFTHNTDGKPMNPDDYIILTGGLFWLAVLIIKQAVAYRHHSTVIRSHHYEDKP